MHFAYNSNFQGKDIKKNIYMQVFTHLLFAWVRSPLRDNTKAEHQASSNTTSDI